MVCYYKILGVSVRASQEEIKRAFRLLALRWHPDRNSGDAESTERFKEILTAYETLTDRGKRAQYDKERGYGRSRKKKGRSRFQEKTGPSSSSFEEILEEAFGIQYSSFRERKGNDLRFDLQVPRSAAASGTFEHIDFARVVFCNQCMGNGRKVPLPSCTSCRGNGEMEERCSLRVWIPAGSEQGSRVRIAGAGDQPLPGCRAGDLVVLLHVVEGR